jgi:photosystem II stability/assembly factor-like uncharacterized protein
VAASGDGSVLIAATALFFDGRIYLSLDGGTTWALAPTSQPGNWRAAAASADGSILAVAHSYLGSSFVLVSTDRGTSWTVRDSGTRDWVAIAMTGDGQRWLAADRDRLLYVSTDQGTTWTPTESERPWTDVSISTDGRRLLAAAADGSVVTSGDGGQTWTLRTPYGTGLDTVALAGNASRVYGCLPGAGLVFSQPVAVASFSTAGTAGYLAGAQYQTVALQFLGDGIWNVLSYVGSSFEAE